MPVETTFAIVDAFTTEHPFSGNPAGVVVLDAYPDDVWMQGVANELHQAETAFLVPAQDPASFRLRWFTPVAEVALCGHATLASAHWLWESGTVPDGSTITFTTASGPLSAVRDGDQVVLDFPSVPAEPVPPSADLHADLRTALDGAVPVWTGITSNDDPGERNVLAVLETEAAVRGLAPDLQAVTRLPAGGLIVTAKTRTGGVVSRYFAPAYGIPEDPVTGSAHCTIGPYWQDQLGTTLLAEQASPRGGALRVDTGTAGRVHLSGTARTAVTGLIH
ncbi:PhzF family phenazine biosynthesis protein [Nocardioides sp. zg-1308]|uniref:PhzF family phenazine biosynthesis protein n=1 Tax=Nocardioides sp. zg-1308 TaxID=2736253 RepID=UPI001553FD3D|nr:PhzF family phenazine biosynthesis protein [Nocardioides sp. zg-1308]NPD06060.1 PhzF family phenazine biosynthesis protein [Nocardioides sp. zg-1308]